MLTRYPPSGRRSDLDQSSHMLTLATCDLFSELDETAKTVSPGKFWTVCSFHLLFLPNPFALPFQFVAYSNFSLHLTWSSTLWTVFGLYYPFEAWSI